MLKEKHIIDFFKGLTLPFCLSLIWYFSFYNNTTIWIYTAIHGSYGLFWCMKSYYFPDKQWEKEVTVIRLVKLIGGLSGYWLSPYLIIHYNREHSNHYLAVCTLLYASGVFYHFAGDMQKHVSLDLKPGYLIDSGLWSNCRNPNYFGEFLIYITFAALSYHWMSLGVLLSIIIIEWLPNMKKKDTSLSRYESFAKYKSNSNLFFPKNIMISLYLLTIGFYFIAHFLKFI
jgi:protein-S-isoprenylcysteine O-methyltransferase Ste14